MQSIFKFLMKQGDKCIIRKLIIDKREKIISNPKFQANDS